jgi:hypothetical protein
MLSRNNPVQLTLRLCPNTPIESTQRGAVFVHSRQGPSYLFGAFPQREKSTEWLWQIAAMSLTSFISSAQAESVSVFEPCARGGSIKSLNRSRLPHDASRSQDIQHDKFQHDKFSFISCCPSISTTPRDKSPPEGDHDPTQHCWLCEKSFAPTRVTCPECKGYVIPTMAPDSHRAIHWRLVTFGGNATPAERSSIMNDDAKYITRIENNVAICGLDSTSGKHVILARVDAKWRLSFKTPTERNATKSRPRKVTAEEWDLFCQIMAVNGDGKRKLQRPHTRPG